MEIQLKNISKKFGDKKVLDKVNIIFNEPITCIMGTSGVGKTTLVNIILGLTKQDEGEITEIKDKKIGVVFQDDRLCENIDTIKNIELVCNNGKKEIEKEIENIGLKDVANKPVIALSGGMRRKVCILRALFFDSDIIIMDEPFKGMDDETRENTIEYVKKSLKNRKLIVITHNKEDVEHLGAKIEYLRKI